MGHAASAAPGSVVLASNHYSLCGRLMFEMGDSPPVYCPTARRSAFDFFDRRDPPADATVVALTTDIHEELPAGPRGTQLHARRHGRHRARRPPRRALLRPVLPARSFRLRNSARLATRLRPPRSRSSSSVSAICRSDARGCRFCSSRSSPASSGSSRRSSSCAPATTSSCPTTSRASWSSTGSRRGRRARRRS